jgi:hypothetical protein
VTCYLLHIMEDPDRDAYRDADLKDVVGLMPRFFCAQCQPLRPLLSSQAVKCMRRNAPCWRPADDRCSADGTGPGQAQDGGPGGEPSGGESSGGGPYTF